MWRIRQNKDVEEVMTCVDELVKHHFNISDNYLSNELLIRSEILKRNFTKRQTNIIIFIFSLSFPYGKKSALIPKLQDFEVCGVTKTKIKEELEKLEILNVIDWDRELHLFSIKFPYHWNAPYHAGASRERSLELLDLNKKHAEKESETKSWV